ncbi:carboxypeptidase-like regulatory domain-containing protein [Billgrantia kenyensis]|uniref:Carboxypeptidase regulatory-like domain-containing protein n=1 Tax=Billgrantia kenyensis TaxID=321266 RepID=A0A7W0ACL4_9GAMM|nr:carboxypeptidase-like regulatory domain-containing protein [Halomonas kenyensis]MBA2777669.1 carboxypeptidase regulatory-like domain-containing protein [Halomonas kenyensis]MCG6660339.1 carboxypeptidase regulatory-like domain-containing protein [Halomonas kenyensis]
MKAWIPLALLGLTLAGCQMQPGPPPERIEVIDVSDPQRTEEIRPDAEPTAPPPGRIARQVAFPAEEYAQLERTGNAAISGRLSLNGSPGAGETVSVAPVTTYSAEAAEHALAGRAVEPADPRAREFTHTARTDGNGNFTINGLPAGEFYVSGSMVNSSGQRQVILRQVSLRNGQRLEVNLSR